MFVDLIIENNSADFGGGLYLSESDAIIENISVSNNKVDNITVNGDQFEFDGVVAAADYHHVEQVLIPLSTYPWTLNTLLILNAP